MSPVRRRGPAAVAVLVFVLALAAVGALPGAARAGSRQIGDPLGPSGDPTSSTTSTLFPGPPPSTEPTPTTDTPTTTQPFRTTTTEAAPEPEEETPSTTDATDTTETSETTASTTTVDLLVGPPASTTTTSGVAAVRVDGETGLSDSTKLWLIVSALVGVAVLLTAFTFIYWRRTRPVSRRRVWDPDSDGDSEPTAVQPVR